MGLFNMMRSIDQCNELLPRAEAEVSSIFNAMDCNDTFQVIIHTQFLKEIYKDLYNTMDKSMGARQASYSFLGEKKSGEELMRFMFGLIKEITDKINDIY